MTWLLSQEKKRLPKLSIATVPALHGHRLSHFHHEREKLDFAGRSRARIIARRFADAY
jgi:hypothetical protein